MPVVIIVDSTIVGVAKPDPAIFSFALDVLDVKPEHVAYVGDSYAQRRRRGSRWPACGPSCSIPTTTMPVRTTTASRPWPSSTWSATRLLEQAAGDHLEARVSSAPSKIESTRASTKSRLTVYSSA